MTQNPFPVWFPFFAIAWVVFFIGVSIEFRRRKGKPVFPAVPNDALYVDKWASGRWASNCLLVAVTDKALSVVPRFPFNLGFLPEVYGLERTIPVRAIREARRLRGLGLGNNVAVDYGDGELRLKVRNPQAFLDALARSSSPHLRELGPFPFQSWISSATLTQRRVARAARAGSFSPSATGRSPRAMTRARDEEPT